MSFDVILPFLRPIEGLIKDPAISEIMVNGPSCMFIEREGQVEPVPGVSIPEKSLQVAVGNIARAVGDEISEEKPLLDSTHWEARRSGTWIATQSAPIHWSSCAFQRPTSSLPG